MKQQPRKQNVNESNLIVAVAGTVLISGVCSLYTAKIIDDVLEAVNHSQSMALIIYDGGKDFISDDGKLGEQLSDATQALHSSYDIAVSLAIGSAMVALALVYRVTFKNKVTTN